MIELKDGFRILFIGDSITYKVQQKIEQKNAGHKIISDEILKIIH